MDSSIILKHVDHTMLAPSTTYVEIQSLCEEAIKYHTASVCIPPSYVKRVAQDYNGQVAICTVIGFPLGYNTTSSKVAEGELAVQDGADELDMVVNIGDVKNGDFGAVLNEIKAMKKVAGNRILKVIIETCYLTEEEKVELCRCVSEGGADYIKTSTGFGTGGATLEDIILLKKYIAPHVKIKASGGVRTREDFEKYIEAGCSRIGASSAVKVLMGDGSAAAGY